MKKEKEKDEFIFTALFFLSLLFLTCWWTDCADADVEHDLAILNEIPMDGNILYVNTDLAEMRDSYADFIKTVFSLNLKTLEKKAILQGSIFEMSSIMGKKTVLLSAGDITERYGTPERKWEPTHHHIWLYKNNKLVQVTKGNVIDESMEWSEANNLIYFSRAPNVRKVNNLINWDINNIWSVSEDGSNLKQLTFSKNTPNINPRPSIDGRKIVFATNRNEKWQLFIMNSDGSDQHLFIDDGIRGHWSPDGQSFAYVDKFPGDVFISDKDGKNIRKIETGGNIIFGPTWSPDGKTIAYTKMRDFTKEEQGDLRPDFWPGAIYPGEPTIDIWVVSIEGKEPPRRLTTEGIDNHNPSWLWVNLRDG